MDFIVKLPESEGYDSILTITDQGCTKMAIFLPCNETIDTEGVAQLYFQHIFPQFGVPLKVVMSTSSTREYEYSWEIPKRKLILDSYSSMRVPVWDASTRVRVRVLLISVRVLVSDEYSLRDEYYEYSSEYLPLRVLK